MRQNWTFLITGQQVWLKKRHTPNVNQENYIIPTPPPLEKYYYPAKIWLAFGEAVNGNLEISGWLRENGFPEVAALAHAIRGGEEATTWLFQNKFFHLAALDAAIDENVQAYQWLIANKHPFLVVFADACRGKQAAIQWFYTNKMEAFVLFAQRIKFLRDNTTFDYHKKNF